MASAHADECLAYLAAVGLAFRVLDVEDLLLGKLEPVYSHILGWIEAHGIDAVRKQDIGFLSLGGVMWTVNWRPSLPSNNTYTASSDAPGTPSSASSADSTVMYTPPGTPSPCRQKKRGCSRTV
ncbi:hypothetical protein B0A48_14513 [Cryoendolithus antarcticus]|uniref:Uncharacterized protein n=1 Tax=Cryoendolithus antarcticus TaxID=1507870 RepID=A0A1V8SKZ0_9PEZI|nr:hypothetical protein B0A48_14513 [Cryoendolithus antarcticus]